MRLLFFNRSSSSPSEAAVLIAPKNPKRFVPRDRDRADERRKGKATVPSNFALLFSRLDPLCASSLRRRLPAALVPGDAFHDPSNVQRSTALTDPPAAIDRFIFVP